MTQRSLRSVPTVGKRKAPGRFASVIDEQQLRQEEVDAFRVAVLQTGLRDRSAVTEVAELLGLDEKSVYNLAEGRTKKNPIRDFFAFVDTCIAAKQNERALEPVWLGYRRYLVPPVETQMAEQECGAVFLKEAGEGIQAYLGLLDGASLDEALAALQQIDELIRIAYVARGKAAAIVAAGGER
jgi:hypothetical protein